MPIYEYHCSECNADFERLVRTEKDAVVCECGNADVERRWSVFAAHSATGSSGSASMPVPPCQMNCPGGGCGLS